MHRVLQGIIKHQRIAAAYLFVGPPGAGKAEAAVDFASQLGCKNIDLIRVKPDGASLKIEQVWELQQMVRYGPHSSPYLVALVEEADKLTTEAAGAFLKTLEEPPAKVVFILTVEREERILPTINSRCQKIIFGEPLLEWKPNTANAEFYRELKNLRGRSAPELLNFAARLYAEKENIEILLYDLVFFARRELADLKLVRTLLTAVKNIKKRANLRLALEVACLETGAA